jgi:hypothetical protein
VIGCSHRSLILLPPTYISAQIMAVHDCEELASAALCILLKMQDKQIQGFISCLHGC